MRILITGGSGFIGSHVVDRALVAGHEPVIFDLERSPYHTDVEAVLGNITDADAIERALEGCDAVVHLAAVADVGEVHTSPERSEQVNSRGTLAVLEAMRRAGVGRIVYGSTIWVYSDCEETDVDEETSIQAPAHLYTATKLAGELYCRSYSELYGIEYTILRFGIPYGPRAREAAVLPIFVGKAESGQPLTVAGSGSQSRQFVYVEDLAEGVVAGLAEGATNRIYNLTRDESVTILQVAETVRDVVGVGEVVHVEGRDGDFKGRTVSAERARVELGWVAETPFSEGVRRYVDWRQSQNGAEIERTAGAAKSTSRAPRVLVLTADIGEGHDLPARALAAEITAMRPGAQVSVVDGLAAMGRLIQMMLRDSSWFMFRRMRWLFDLQYFFLTRVPPTRWLASRLGYLLTARRMSRLISAHTPDAIVSTYPGVTEMIGELRHRRRLDVPCYSAITDLAGLRFWSNRGIDMHFVIYEESIEEVEKIAGPGSARWARPPTSPEFFRDRSSVDARRALGLPVEGPIVVISGGGWGMGDLSGALYEALEVQDATVVCLTGRHEDARRRLERRFADEPRARIIGFTDRMSDLLAAADVLVHSTAGLTVLEAQIRGCQVISYGFGIGHIRANNAAYKRFGLAQVARSRKQLQPALRRALADPREPDPTFARLPSPAGMVLEARKRIKPLPAWRVRFARVAVTATATIAVLGWSLASNAPYNFVAKTFKLRPTTAVATSLPEVGVVIDAPPEDTLPLARELRRWKARASFAVDDPPPPATLDALRRVGDEALPLIDTGGAVRWLKTRGDLKSITRGLGISGHFHYVVPAHHGLSLGAYALARSAGGSAVSGGVQFEDGDSLAPLKPGQIVEVTSPAGTASAPLVRALLIQLHREGLHAVPVGELMADGN